MITYAQALKVARKDYDTGIIWAIDLLATMGFNCNSYYKALEKMDIDSKDYDIKNIQARDNLFKELQISEIMEKAYNDIWG